MAFEIIDGGGLDSLQWSEMTDAQKLQYEAAVWQDIEPEDGSIEAVFKYLPLESAELAATIQTLKAIRSAVAEQTGARGLRDEWRYIDADYLLRQLQQRARMEAAAAPAPDQTGRAGSPPGRTVRPLRDR